jgi:hypothetical protein
MKKILVIEDNGDKLTHITCALGSSGHEILPRMAGRRVLRSPSGRGK